MRPKWCLNNSRVSVKYLKQHALKSVTNYNCVSAKNRLRALSWLSDRMFLVISCIEAKLMKTGCTAPIRLFQELTLLRSGTIAPCFRSAKNRPLGEASHDKPLISKIEDTFFKRLSKQGVSCNSVDLKVTTAPEVKNRFHNKGTRQRVSSATNTVSDACTEISYSTNSLGCCHVHESLVKVSR